MLDFGRLYGMCSGVQWEMQGYRLKFDLLAMELGAYDVVLGVDWMRKFPIISISLSVGCN